MKEEELKENLVGVLIISIVELFVSREEGNGKKRNLIMAILREWPCWWGWNSDKSTKMKVRI